jgi:hypothetical protein
MIYDGNHKVSMSFLSTGIKAGTRNFTTRTSTFCEDDVDNGLLQSQTSALAVSVFSLIMYLMYGNVQLQLPRVHFYSGTTLRLGGNFVTQSNHMLGPTDNPMNDIPIPANPLNIRPCLAPRIDSSDWSIVTHPFLVGFPSNRSATHRKAPVIPSTISVL